MEFPSLDVEERYHEFRFGPEDVRTFAHGLGESDPRTFGEKLLLKKRAPRPPRWTASDEAFEFTCGGGATGVGTLWTRPLLVEPGLALRSAFLHFLERRKVDEAAEGEQNVIVHVRRAPAIGDGEDVAERVLPVHAARDAADASWHGHFVDLSDLLTASRSEPLYVTVEAHVTCTRTPRLGSAVAFGFREVGLTLHAGNAAHAPRVVSDGSTVVRSITPSGPGTAAESPATVAVDSHA